MVKLVTRSIKEKQRQSSVTKKLPLIEVSGYPNEIGYKIGLQYKGFIRKEFNYLLETVMRLSSKLSSKEEILRLTSKYAPYAQEYAPELIEEVEGIAEGAELTFEEVFFLNCFSDIFSDISFPTLATKLLSCSAFGVSKEITAGHQVFVGQNFDLNILFQDFPIILKINSKSGPSSLVYTMVGIIGCIGQNSFGLSVANNKLFSSDSRPGVPFTFVVRKILEQKTIGEAMDAVITAHRATGLNYIIGDSGGEIFSLETTATDIEVIYSHFGYIAHANHFLTQRLKQYQLALLGDSLLRYDRIVKLLKAKRKEINVEYLKKVLKDHINFPRSICYHPDVRIPEYKRMKTISAVIMQPSKRVMYVANGNPCQNEFKEYEI